MFGVITKYFLATNIIMSTDEHKTVKCYFCGENFAKYSCPQCLLKYCCVSCYQHPKHLKCSEEFYKQQVTSELKQMKVSPEEKKRLIDRLIKNTHIDKPTDDMVNRFESIDLDDSKALWEALSQDEKEMFQRKVESGDIDFVDKWEPWWKNSKDKKFEQKTPKVIENVPTMRSLLGSRKPNDNIKISVLEVLLGYSCMQQLYNGDIYDAPEDCVDTLLKLSDVLNENRVYDDINIMLCNFKQKLETDETIGVTTNACVGDVIMILEYKDGCVKALSELYRYFKRCRRYFKKESNVLYKKCFNIEKRVLFLISYAKEYILIKNSLSAVLKNFMQTSIEDKETFQAEKESVANFLKKSKPQVHLIEELN